MAGAHVEPRRGPATSVARSGGAPFDIPRGRGKALSASPELSVRLEKYELLEEIGHGGMATVWRARDRRLGREVAVKIIHRHLREHREVGQRFESEARAVAKLKHPNIVEVYDVSDSGEDERYLVVELVRGTTLRQLLADESYLPAEIAACIAVELAGALDHAHQHGVIHRDVKPENVLVATPVPASAANDADPVHIKITDFGIAKLLDAQGVTSTGQVLGSPAHMAPEQIEGGEVNARADVFGLGVLLYESMVGRLPFDGKNPAQVLRRVLDGAFTPAERARPTVGSAYSSVLDRALAHETKDRYASAADFAAALREELTALGFTSPRRELHAFLSDPAGYRAGHERRIVERLVARARASRGERNFPLVAASYNRALAYRPDDPELLASVSTIARGEKLRQSARRVGVALLGVASLAVATAGVTRWLRNVPDVPDEPVVPSTQGPLPPPLVSSGRVGVLPDNADKPVPSAVASPVASQPAPLPVPVRLAPPPRTVETTPPRPGGTARVRVVVDGPQNATVRIDGAEIAWFGTIHELVAGEHTFEFVPPDDQCCIGSQTRRVSVPVSDGPDDFEVVRGRIEFRPAILQLIGPAGSTASCGALGQFAVPSVQEIPMATGVKNAQCLLFPPEGSADPPKQFDVTLTPGRTFANPGQ